MFRIEAKWLRDLPLYHLKAEALDRAALAQALGEWVAKWYWRLGHLPIQEIKLYEVVYGARLATTPPQWLDRCGSLRDDELFTFDSEQAAAVAFSDMLADKLRGGEGGPFVKYVGGGWDLVEHKEEISVEDLS